MKSTGWHKGQQRSVKQGQGVGFGAPGREMRSVQPNGAYGRAVAKRRRQGTKVEAQQAPVKESVRAVETQYPPERLRNFSVIAHVDHGKSTLVDCMLEHTRAVQEREMQEQFLDNMELERERGITIKLQTSRLTYFHPDGSEFVLQLVDTPGHVDFSYEVSRSLAACEGALLVVDASQGVEAQTVANVYLALENDLELIPVINKCDLPQADPEGVAREVEEVIGLDCSNAIFASAKSGEGLQETLNAIVEQIPPPKAAPADPLRALIFDSYYDPYKGVVVFFRIHEGTLRKGESIRFFGSGKEYTVDDLGVMAPNKISVDVLGSGEVGFLSAHIKQVSDARVGDTITSVKQPAEKQLEGYLEARPMVFCGLFTTDKDDYEDLRDALEKLQLNDSALTFEPEISTALGFGFRVGFLGLLHLEIVQERLEREYSLDLVTTAPTVRYRVVDHNNERHEVESPSSMPPPEKRAAIEEPFARMDILTPSDYVGKIMELCHERRGEFKNMSYINPTRASLSYDMPLAEVVTDFFDQVKSRSKGYASMEYTYLGYRTSELVRLDMKVNGEMMEPLSCIVHREKAHSIGRQLCKKLAKRIERHNFKIPIQAAIGGTIVASEHISALRKDVLAKCYGGDVSRKRKLLAKQAEGKKRMKMMGSVNVPQSALMSIISLGEEDD